MTTFIALLRGINIGGHNKIPMAELRELCGNLGWKDVQSYIQSGNLVFRAASSPADLEARLEKAIELRFGLAIPVIIRSAADWRTVVEGNPFPEESRTQPNWVALVVPKAPPRPDAMARLRERAEADERVTQVGDVFWISYGNGIARSKLTPGLLDRLAGSPVTARNWRTVLKLAALAEKFQP